MNLLIFPSLSILYHKKIMWYTRFHLAIAIYIVGFKHIELYYNEGFLLANLNFIELANQRTWNSQCHWSGWSLCEKALDVEWHTGMKYNLCWTSVHSQKAAHLTIQKIQARRDVDKFSCLGLCD